jgi:hypothetical protein
LEETGGNTVCGNRWIMEFVSPSFLCFLKGETEETGGNMRKQEGTRANMRKHTFEETGGNKRKLEETRNTERSLFTKRQRSSLSTLFVNLGQRPCRREQGGLGRFP